MEVFERALTAEEIGAIHGAGSAGKVKPPAPEPIAPPDGLVSWWPADGDALDVIDGNHGALVGGATYAPGLIDRAFSLDGNGDYVNLGDYSNLYFSETDFTIEGWFQISDYPNNAGGGCGSRYPILANNAWGYAVQIAETGHVSFGKYYTVSDGVGTTSADPVSIGQWHHFAAVHTVTELRLYVDGQLSSTADSPSGAVFYQVGDRPEIGRLNCGNLPYFYFKGLIDELGMYSRALTDEEIRSVFEAVSEGKIKPEPVPPPAGLVSWWPGDGNANDITDGNDGTLVGGATFAPGMVGEAFSLDGVDDFVEIPDPDNVESPTGTMTLWVMTTTDYSAANQENDYVVGKQTPIDPKNSSFALLFPGALHTPGATGKIQFWIRDSAATNRILLDSTSDLNDGQWHFIAVQWGSGGMKLYVDGALDQSDPFAGWWDGNAGNLFIGTIVGRLDLAYGGLVDEVDIYSRALTADEIRAIYDVGSAGKIKPPQQ